MAAFRVGLRYIGIELLEQYHRAGQQRLAVARRAIQYPAANDEFPEAT
ncbi:putative methylase [Salmonella enterica subsp. enterica serovar Newport str. CVM 4176]|nr:putative methylase [Salmonella enterica subsp. enterica serovar Newport str. CVM 4176]